MSVQPLISIIIRTKNEAAWIRRCLTAASLQDYPRREIVVVDNESDDGTSDVIRQFDCKVIPISDAEFSYGRALNRGIQASKGDFLVCLSGHCVPVHNKWLDRLIVNFGPPQVGAVYGRQEHNPKPTLMTRPLLKCLSFFYPSL